jgi:hypothetical protein
MTTAAVASIAARATGPLSRWLSVRHPLRTEAAAVLTLYGLYEVARGLVVGNGAEAERHALRLAATERSLHLLPEEGFAKAPRMRGFRSPDSLHSSSAHGSGTDFGTARPDSRSRV